VDVFGHGSNINLVYDYMATDLEVNVLKDLFLKRIQYIADKFIFKGNHQRS
jgi:hypothetical protein